MLFAPGGLLRRDLLEEVKGVFRGSGEKAS
jgi:hypothetical protein